MAHLSTHVLDQYHGRPAKGVRIRLYTSASPEPLAEVVTNADGRVDQPMIEGGKGGPVQLVFDIGEYFNSQGVDSPFLERVPVWCTLQEDGRYHVPLLVTPWAYSVYRGS